MLILGTADAGKSTLIRHMRQLHGQELGSLEMEHFKSVIRISCLEILASVVENFLKDKPITKNYCDLCECFLEHYRSISEPDMKFIEEALTIWKISALQDFLRQITIDGIQLRDQFINSHQIEDTGNKYLQTLRNGQRIHSDNPLNHFMKCFDRIMEPGYQPSLKDILNLRVPTSGWHY